MNSTSSLLKNSSADLNHSKSPLQPDIDQACLHLKLLGYSPSEQIFLRTFAAKNLNKHLPKELQVHGKNSEVTLTTLPTTQDSNRGVYFVVNGQGQKKASVTTGRALFIEFDHKDGLTTPEQLKRVANSGLPKPTCQVITRNGSHHYWVFAKSDWGMVPIHEWQELTLDVIEVLGSDKTIKDPSRVMRLAGYFHTQVDKETGESLEPQMCRLVSNGGQRYQFQDLRRAIPKRLKEISKKTLTATPNTSAQVFPKLKVDKSQKLSDILREIILPRLKPEAIFNWSGHQFEWSGDGKARGYCPWHDSNSGTAFHMEPNGRNGEWLWHCPSCGIGGGAIEYRHRLAGGNGSPRGERFVAIVQNLAQEAGVEMPQREFVVPLQISNHGNHDQLGISKTASLTIDDVRQQLEHLNSVDVAQSDIEIQIAELARASEYPPSTINRIYQSLVSDADLRTATQGAAGDLEQLRTVQRLQLPIEYGLHGDGGRFAGQIQQVAEAMPTAAEFVVTTLIPVLALAMGTAQTLIIHRTAGYTARAIFRSIIVARTGCKKTPAQLAVLKAVTILEESAANDYAAQITDYGQEHREWLKASRGDKDPGPEPQKPIRQRYITQDSTLAARIQIHSENPRGMLLYKDEASAFINERGRFTNGKGDGGEFEADLSEFNGGAVMSDRKGDGSIFMAKTAINRVGATQYTTLQRLMGSHDDDCGEFARYLFCAAEAPPSKIDLDKDVGDIGLTSTIMNLFNTLYTLPEQSYLLSSEAKIEFQNYQHELTDRQIAEDHPSLQSAYPKFETYFGRFILWLHLVNAALAGQAPEPVVDGYTVELARQWTEYFIGQLKLVLAINSPQQELTGELLKVYDYLKRKGKPLDVRAIQGGRLFARSTDKAKQRANYLKELLSTLVEQGWIAQQGGLYSLNTPNSSSSAEQNKNIGQPTQQKPNVERTVEQMLSSR